MRFNYSMLQFKQSLRVASFLGGISLAVLTFLFQIDENKLPHIDEPFLSIFGTYKEILIFVAGTAGTLLILSVYAIKVVLVHKRKGNETFSIIAIWMYKAGFVGLALLLPLLMYPASQRGVVLISIIEIGWFVFFMVSKRTWRGPSIGLHRIGINSITKNSRFLNQFRAVQNSEFSRISK
jgi:hypothetical protein